jgi:hypothetical protein
MPDRQPKIHLNNDDWAAVFAEQVIDGEGDPRDFPSPKCKTQYSDDEEYPIKWRGFKCTRNRKEVTCKYCLYLMGERTQVRGRPSRPTSVGYHWVKFRGKWMIGLYRPATSVWSDGTWSIIGHGRVKHRAIEEYQTHKLQEPRR